ncbi:hypothetical protein FG152_24550 [Ochrobactrum sp. XJ1]|nr:hypothetical protein [Ochrobactrum sp. XJ1]
MILFHSGNLVDSTSFWPLTHFGTRKAATARAHKRCTDSLKKNLPPPATYMYECEVDLSTCRIIHTDHDWLWPNGLALVVELFRLKHLPSDDEGVKATRHIRLGRGDARRERELCFDLLRDFEIGAISYVNDVEDRGAISYCVINPALITVLNREELLNCP